MKFTVKLKDLKDSISKVLPAIPPKSTLPVLEHFWFKIKDNELSIISTDQDITIESVISVESDADGAILVPARKLNDSCKNIANVDNLDFIVNESNFEITGETMDAQFKMKGLNPDEYPDLPELYDSKKPDYQDGNFVGDLGEFKPAYLNKSDITILAGKTSFAVSNDEFRPAMTGVLFQFKGEYLRAVSTDSYRLVRSTYHSEEHNLPNDIDVIIPSKTIDLLKSVSDDVILSFVSNNGKITHIRFDIGNTVYISRIIDEKFPPYESVIPNNNTLRAIVDKALLLSAVKFVSPSSSSISKQIKMTITTNKITIKGQDEDSGTEAKKEVPCSYEGDEIEIGFNYKFLEDAVSNIDTNDENEINITLSEPTRPALLMPDEDGSEILMLIMPVRIS